MNASHNPPAAKAPAEPGNRLRTQLQSYPHALYTYEMLQFHFNRQELTWREIERNMVDQHRLRHEAAQRAEVSWHADRKAEAAAIATRLKADPARNHARLVRTFAGASLVVNHLKMLLATLEHGDWNAKQRVFLLDLIGVPKNVRHDDTPIYAYLDIQLAALRATYLNPAGKSSQHQYPKDDTRISLQSRVQAVIDHLMDAINDTLAAQDAYERQQATRGTPIDTPPEIVANNRRLDALDRRFRMIERQLETAHEAFYKACRLAGVPGAGEPESSDFATPPTFDALVFPRHLDPNDQPYDPFEPVQPSEFAGDDAVAADADELTQLDGQPSLSSAKEVAAKPASTGNRRQRRRRAHQLRKALKRR